MFCSSTRQEHFHSVLFNINNNKDKLDNGNQVGHWIQQDHKNGFMGVIQSVFVLVKSKPLSYFQIFFLRKFSFLTREIRLDK